MIPTIQSGAHPDAEILTAFAEQSLSDPEREQVLAHMAACGRCREVVYLAQQAIEADDSLPATQREDTQEKTGVGWLAVWRWSWIPVAALAGLVGFAVLRHMSRTEAPQTQVAQTLSPPDTMQSTAARRPAAPPHQPQSPPIAESKEKLRTRELADGDEKGSPTSLDQRGSIVAQTTDELASRTDQPNKVVPAGSGGVTRGAIGPVAKSSNIRRPEAQNQLSSNERSLQRFANALPHNKNLADAANKPTSGPLPLAGASESVSVQAESALEPASAAPSSAPQVAADKDSRRMVLSNKKLAKAVELALPSGLGVLSEAAADSKIVALDTAGSLFLSNDGGKQWVSVKPQWTGRAMSVKARSTADGLHGNVLTQGAAEFELLTDDLQKWHSQDGQKWSLESPAGK